MAIFEAIPSKSKQITWDKMHFKLFFVPTSHLTAFYCRNEKLNFAAGDIRDCRNFRETFQLGFWIRKRSSIVKYCFKTIMFQTTSMSKSPKLYTKNDRKKYREGGTVLPEVIFLDLWTHQIFFLYNSMN